MAAYLYEWVHIPSHKFYIGSRTQIGCHINDGYICSSTLIENEIKNNPNDWVKVILAEGDSKEILKLEENMLNLLNVIKNKYCLNQTNFKGEIVFKSLSNGKRTEPLKNNLHKIPSIIIL